jgi:hypothetical protein
VKTIGVKEETSLFEHSVLAVPKAKYDERINNLPEKGLGN